TVTPYDVSYDGDPHTASGTAKGVKAESLSGLDLSHTTHTNAGTYNTDYWSFSDSTGNYNNIGNTIITDHIAKADATITVTPYDVSYDGDPHTASGTAKGVKAESLSGLDLSHKTHTNAGTYNTDYWSFSDGTGNYNNIGNTIITDHIAKADATIMVTPYDVSYDGDPHTASGTAKGVKAESLSGLDLSHKTHTNAGTYNTDYWFFSDSTGNYNNIGNTIITDHIAKADATITVTPYDVSYDGDPHTASGTAKGVKAESLSGLDLSHTTHTNAGTYNTDYWSFSDSTGNYNNIGNTIITDHIAKADATITVTPYDVSYDGDPHTASGTAKGVKAESLSGLDLSHTTHTNAGTYNTDYWSFSDSTGNYNNIGNTIITDHIAKADATIMVTTYDVSYDGDPHTASGTAKGVKAESLSGLDLSHTTHTDAGTYNTDYWSFSDSTGNYNNIGNTIITDHIAKADATVVVTPYTSATTTYDGNAHTATVTSIAGVNGETGAIVGTVDVSHTTHTNADTYASDYWFFTATANYNNIGNTTIIDSI